MAGYLAAREIRFPNALGAFQQSQDRVLQNALAERQAMNSEQAQQFQQNRLMQQDATAAQLRQEQQAALQAEKSKASEQDERTQVFNYLSHLSRATKPEQFAFLADRMAATPLFQKYQITREDLTPEEVAQALRMVAAQAGQAPADQFEEVQGPRGSIIKRNLRTGDMSQVVGPDNTESRPAAGGFRALTPPEVQAAGLPPGTSAQVGPDGKIDVLSKRDNTGVLSQKDATTAKMKLNTVQLARQQLMAIKNAFKSIKGTASAGAFGQGRIPTPSGRAFDAAVDQMRSTLTALTRVPGVGAMSDYETRLDQAKFPDRKNFEQVTEQQIKGIEDMLALIESGYQGLLSGESQPQRASQPSGGWSVEVIQ